MVCGVEIDFLTGFHLETPGSVSVVVAVHRGPLPDEDTLCSVTQSDYVVTVVENVVLLFMTDRSLVVVHG